jgi:BMFP domain-containing protein YqiC
MLDDVRRYMEAALGQMSPPRAREVARSVLQGQPTEQVNRFARDLAGWSQRARERVIELVRSEVKRQLKAMGVVTRDDLDAVRARLRDLEKAGGRSRASNQKSSRAKRPASKRSPAKTSSSKRSTTTRSTAKKSNTSKDTQRKATAGSSSSGGSARSAAAAEGGAS